MRIAIAGGTGFVGRTLTRRLRQDGHEVVVLARGCNRDQPDEPGVSFHAIDLGTQIPPAHVLGGCDVVVNLVGIKRQAGENGFERAHVTAVAHLLAGCREASVQRFVHISVAGARTDPDNPYLATKAAGERLVRASNLEWTIVRPGIIYGRGDDLLTQLVGMLRIAPVFPLPGSGQGQLAVVDVEDVAEAIVRCIARPVAVAREYDVVGPEAWSLRRIVPHVARAAGLSAWCVPMPSSLQLLAAAQMERFANPLVTRSQLRLLMHGVTGDPEPARRDLAIEPRTFTDDRIATLAAQIPARIPALALVPDAMHAQWLRQHRVQPLRVGAFLAGVSVAMLVLPLWLPHVWGRMALISTLAAAVAVLGLRLPWRELFRVRARDLAVGLAGACVLYGLGATMHAVLALAWPAVATRVHDILAWKTLLPTAIAVPLLLETVVVEDIVWRAAIGLPLASYLGPWRGSLLAAIAFAVAHLTSGPLVLLLAAVGAGWFWNLLLIRTRSLPAVIVAHAAWDVLVLWVRPY